MHLADIKMILKYVRCHISFRMYGKKVLYFNIILQPIQAVSFGLTNVVNSIEKYNFHLYLLGHLGHLHYLIVNFFRDSKS